MKYFDMSNHNEDCRIRQIGLKVMENPGAIIGFVTDDDEGKLERYIAKIQEWFPLVELIDKHPGPVPKTVLARLRRKGD